MKTYASRRLPFLLAAGVLALGAAPAAFAQAPAAVGAPLTVRAERSADTWTDFLRTEALTVRLDTARVERRSADGALLVWVRFEYADPEPVPGRPGEQFSRMEIREALDCEAQRVADVELLIRDSTERVLGTTRPGTEAWKTFAEHPFDPDLFILACRQLAPRVGSLARR